MDYDYLRAIGKELQPALIDGLSLATELAGEKAAIFLAEDADIAAQRAALKQKKERLDGVLKKLFEFGM